MLTTTSSAVLLFVAVDAVKSSVSEWKFCPLNNQTLKC